MNFLHSTTSESSLLFWNVEASFVHGRRQNNDPRRHLDLTPEPGKCGKSSLLMPLLGTLRGRQDRREWRQVPSGDKCPRRRTPPTSVACKDGRRVHEPGNEGASRLEGFPGGSAAESPPAMQGDPGDRSLGGEDPQKESWAPAPVLLPENRARRSLWATVLEGWQQAGTWLSAHTVTDGKDKEAVSP